MSKQDMELAARILENLPNLTPGEVQWWNEHPEELEKHLARLRRSIDIAVLYSEVNLPEVVTWNKTTVNVRDLIIKLRRFWSEQLDYTGDVCGVRVNSAYHLKTASKEGKCYEDLRHLQSWDIPDEERTHDIIFLAPPVQCHHLLNKNAEAQVLWFRQMERQYGFPKDFLSFGTVQSVSAMMLAYRRITDECLAEDSYLRTDSLHDPSRGTRYGVYWLDGAFYCSCSGWSDDDAVGPNVGGLVGASLELPDTP